MADIKELEQYAMEHGIPIIQDEGLKLLKQKIIEYDCHSFLEIGTAIGRTALVVADLVDPMRVVTIERDPQMIEQAKANLEGHTNIQLIEGDALEVPLPKGPFDCIFIDAAKAQYIRFFTRFCPLLSENGIIISDNMNFHGLVDHPERTHNRNTKALVRKIRGYREIVMALSDYETKLYDQGDGVAITKRKKGK